jgi:thiol:disulfide interchange protein DsbD
LRRRLGIGLELGLQWIAILCIATFAQASAPDRPTDASLLPADLPPSAIGKDVLTGDRAQIEARLLVSSGDDPLVGMHFSLADGWHVYWRNPGDTGLPPRIEIEAPGYEIGEIVWPAPSIFEEADGLFTTFGYSDQVLLSMPLERTDASAATDRDGVVRANARVLVCKTECVPATFSLSSPLASALSRDDQMRVDRLFAEARAKAPISNDDLGLEARARWKQSIPAADETGRIELTVSACPPTEDSCDASIATKTSLPFLPFEDSPFEFSDHRIVPGSPSSGSDRIEMEATRLEEGDDRLRGLLVIEDAHGRTLHVAIDVPIDDMKIQRAAPPLPISYGRWMQIFALALLGGLILNGMPCVLPVLAIKIVAIADLAEKSRSEVRLQGLAYTGGVLGSMAILAAVVVFLRSAGHSVGWGFQFQEPLFVATISAILVAFALNLFGVFEIDFGQGRLAAVGQTGSDTRRSIFEGLLAVVLATPCTAPFLGTAVGFAFAASGWTILTIFLAIGFGLALPFLAVSFAPGLARFIPRSGPWMLKLRTGLGFSLLATVVWLLWVVGQSGGTDAMIGLVSMLLLLAFLLWGFGQAQPLASPWLARGSATAIASIAIAGFNVIGFESAQLTDRSRDEAASDPMSVESGWAPYSEAAVADALALGRPAFVVFTADWCITCKVNEKTVLERAAIREAFAASGHALFKADWTRRDDRIRSKLSEFGRAGVPLYLVYSPEAPNDPEVLSELLSQDEVRASLARTAKTDQS